MCHAVALTFENQEMAVVNQSVNYGGSHLFIGEDTAPLRELQVCGQNQTFAFITIGYDAKQQLRSFLVDRYVALFIFDEDWNKAHIKFLQTGYCIVMVRYLFFCEKRGRFKSYAGNRSHLSIIKTRACGLGDLLNRIQRQV